MRRTFVPNLSVGPLSLPAAEAHHLRDVLRLTVGATVELFDAVGHRAIGTIVSSNADAMIVDVQAIEQPTAGRSRIAIHVASAVPKADRADWLVEKLSEIGADRWTPLRTARSVVHPEGIAKFDRWRRIAVEAAKQSRRSGVMEIDELHDLSAALTALNPGARLVILSTRRDSVRPLASLVADESPPGGWQLWIGPEGGWTDDELATLMKAGGIEASLTPTVLRTETAAVLAAGVVAATAEV